MRSLAPLRLRLCPACRGEPEAREACSRCTGAGVLDENDEPFEAPPPFDTWTPERLVALDENSRARDREARKRRLSTTEEGWRMSRTTKGEPIAVREAPKRLTLSEILELVLQRGPADHSSVKLVRNAKGDTQIEVHVRTGEPGLETIAEARQTAQTHYDELRRLYPMAGEAGIPSSTSSRSSSSKGDKP
jgi:hypothetical protein